MNFFPSNRYGKYNVSSPGERTMDGILFASKAEMRRYMELKLLLRAGKIKDLVCQPKFELVPGFILHDKTYFAVNYYADFKYYDLEKDCRVVEDVKGVETEVFKIKEKLMAFRHHIEIKKVKTSEIR